MATRKLQRVHETLFSEATLQLKQETVFELGTIIVTKQFLCKDLDCPFPVAARRLSNELKRIHVKSVAQLNRLKLEGLALKGIGERQCIVATTILNWQGYSVDAFCDWDTEEKPVRYNTVRRRMAD